MIIVMREGAKKKNIDAVIKLVKDAKLKPAPLFGTERTVIAVIGDERILHKDALAAMSEVEKVMDVVKKYKLAAREGHPEDTIIKIKEVKIGGKEIILIAGPCSVESKEQIIKTAIAVKKAGAKILRGGAYKPRTSPYAFQGHGEEGLKMLAEARKKTGLLVATEIMDVRDLPLLEKYADIIQIGARNMQNFTLLREVGKSKKPILLKRGLSATLDELLMSAEYIMSEGNPNVILCERGIRTFETATRNTLDLSAVPMLKELSHLPIIIDPSHATGKYTLVPAMAKAAIAAGADGLLIETHPNPPKSFSDADQTISLRKFEKLMPELKKVAKAVNRKL